MSAPSASSFAHKYLQRDVRLQVLLVMPKRAGKQIVEVVSFVTIRHNASHCGTTTISGRARRVPLTRPEFLPKGHESTTPGSEYIGRHISPRALEKVTHRLTRISLNKRERRGLSFPDLAWG